MALGRINDPIVISDPAVTAVSVPKVTNLLTGTDTTTVKRGEPYSVSVDVTTVGSGNDLMGTLLVLEGNKSDRTILTQHGYLHVDVSESAMSMTITAISTADDTKENSIILTVGGELVDLWPDPHDPIKTPPVTP